MRSVVKSYSQLVRMRVCVCVYKHVSKLTCFLEENRKGSQFRSAHRDTSVDEREGRKKLDMRGDNVMGGRVGGGGETGK